ncbi:MAG: hypothetical protein KDD38_03935 [Bdellovibrionales bacterium]|nr:hypothetical protein [Bdellovibrionales bacterium]
MRKLVFAIFVLVGFSSAAQAGECVKISSIKDWRYARRDVVQVQVSSKKIYELTTFGCASLRWAERIEFKTWPEGASKVCRGDDILVMANFGRRITERCPIHEIERIK